MRTADGFSFLVEAFLKREPSVRQSLESYLKNLRKKQPFGWFFQSHFQN
jgi:hypothetical protein